MVHPSSTIEQLPQADELFILNATASPTLFIRDNPWQGGGILRMYDYRHKLVGQKDWTDRTHLGVPAPGYTYLTRK